MEENYFMELNSVNVNGKTEKKNGLTFLSWSYAWGEVKKRFPDANYTIYENRDEWNYFTDGRTCWVKTGVTINGIEHIEELPVMDFKNKSISVDQVTSYDVNKAIQRSLTKAIARHGLGLYIYAGEDLPEDADPEPLKPLPPSQKKAVSSTSYNCEKCGKPITPFVNTDGKTVSVSRLVEGSKAKCDGKVLCPDCVKTYLKSKEE